LRKARKLPVVSISFQGNLSFFFDVIANRRTVPFRVDEYWPLHPGSNGITGMKICSV
jgi:hypothetical protein